MRICPSCGEENPDRFRLCGFCGTQFAAPAPPAEQRKTVTVVFCDLKGSTAMAERLDPESVREVLSRYFEAMRGVLEAHGAVVEKYIGDAVMAVFGLPRLHEDDALRAVRAAWGMQRALDRLNRDLEDRWGVTLANRIGVNTGEVIAGDPTSGQRLVTGDTVNVAARLEQAAPPMELLIGETTYRLVRGAVDVEPVEPLELKGKAERVPAFRVVGIRPGEGFARRLDVPMVGREAELSTLLDTFERTVTERRCHAATVCAHAGLGKTRLCEEFLQRAGAGATVLRARCLPYGEGITFFPLGQVTRQAAGIGETEEPEEARARLATLLAGQQPGVVERLAAAIGLSRDAYPIEETFWAARKLLEQVAQRRPTIVLFDDIHWAEPTFLSLIQHVLDMAEDSPLMLLCGARHELFEENPGWMEDRTNAVTLVLEALDGRTCARVVQELAGQVGLPSQVQLRILESADGNPLFIEQMVSMIVDDGVTDVSSLSIPPNIAALLAARLDRLSNDERAVLQTASVAGAVFPQPAIEHLSAEGTRERVGGNLVSLAHKRLIRPDDRRLAEADTYRFQHILIRDTTYQSMLKRTRAQLHERYAGWLEGAAGARVLEYEEIIGYHLEQAHRCLAELGPVDAAGAALGASASARLASAGRRALARGDMPAASNLLQRAMVLRPEESPERAALVPDLADALLEVGEFARAEDLIAAAAETARAVDDTRLEVALRMAGQQIAQLADPTAWTQSAATVAEQVIASFEVTGDHESTARAWRMLAMLYAVSGRLGEVEHALQRAIDHARRSGDRRLETRCYATLALCALFGPTPVEDGVRRCELLLEQAAGDRRSQALVMAALAELHAMRGDFQKARDLDAVSRATLEDLGGKVFASAISLRSARVEMRAGDPSRAEAKLRSDLEVLQQVGAAYYVATAAAVLGEALYAQERWDEAEELSRDSERAAGEDDTEAQQEWRCVRAKVAARRGRFQEAERLAREAVDLARLIDSPVTLAKTLMDLAEVLERADKAGEAQAVLRDALALFEAKGDVVSAAAARERLAVVRVLGEAAPRLAGVAAVEA